jgi:hypothetical protein
MILHNENGKMEDDLNFKLNWRRPQFLNKLKTTTLQVKPAQLALASPELGTAQP